MTAQATNGNPMGCVFLALLIVLGSMAVIGGKGAKWKLLNLLIIIGFMAAGITIGYALGVWGGNAAVGAHAGAPLMLGCVGAFGCLRRNRWREKATEKNSNPAPSE
jgi:hypothetical protein